MNPVYDVAVVGSGFAGSLMAMIAKRIGLSVVLVDRGKHPRVVIGESSTPLTNLLLEELSTRYDLPAIRPLTKYGSWRSTYPEVACGLKRGFTFYHHDLDQPSASLPRRDRQLLVAASPKDDIADTHWYRADFDYLLVRQAQDLGVDYFDETYLSISDQSQAGFTFTGTRHEQDLALSARFVIDASGPRGFLHHSLGLKEHQLPGYPRTQAIFNHYSNVTELRAQATYTPGEPPPYAIDDAAVHHLFNGGWIWVLQFNNGLTSAGIAATERAAAQLGFTEPDEAWARVLKQIPVLQEQFAFAEPVGSYSYVKQLSFYAEKQAGANWAMLPSAAGFVDPLLSTGFPLTLLGISRLAAILDNDWNRDHLADRLQGYAKSTELELLATAKLMHALYANMHDFPVFAALTLLYFAAASYSETARRLGKYHLASSFLLHDHPEFGARSCILLESALKPRSKRESDMLVEDILKAIEPINLAGLGEQSRQNWYPVEPEDLLKAAAKVGASQQEIYSLLDRCGIFGTLSDQVIT